ncbi:hypothetical protein L3Q82_005166 [Scortum barcoo]|uniref:Uncharacterized protein n=1 Tax=Scortum barcoo TaxID=214431 RepID=A0ACB8V9G5_9TELE|nr:hypothetical protein L3Q82_005166 [Scortum barcoo]
MKTLERLVLAHLRPLVSSFMDPLQFTYQPDIGVDDAVIYLLHTSLTHLEKAGSTVRIMFFDFSSAFNTIQPRLLGDKLQLAGVDHHLTSWILDYYLTHRPQFKFSDDSAVVGLITDGDDREYRGLIQDFADWCLRNNLQINAGKTKELVVDFCRRSHSLPAPVSIQGTDIDTVKSYKYLGVHLNDSLDALVKKGNSRLFLLRRSHQSTKSMMTFLYSQSFPSDTHPTMAVSSENFWRWQLSVEYVKSDVYRVKRKGERTVPWGAPVLQTTTSDTQSCSLTNWGLSVR